MAKYGRVYHLYIYANISNLAYKTWTDIAVINDLKYKPAISHYFYLTNGGAVSLSPVYFACFKNTGTISIYPVNELGYVSGDCLYIQ